MNLPNILTLSRIALAVVLVFLLEEDSLAGNILAAVVFTIASLTDFYDGYFARKKGLSVISARSWTLWLTRSCFCPLLGSWRISTWSPGGCSS